MMMIQQKDETLQVFTKYAQLVNNLPSFSTFQKTKVTVCTKRKTKQTGFLYVHVMCVLWTKSRNKVSSECRSHGMFLSVFLQSWF